MVMLQNILLVALGFILGIILTMIIESSMAVSYLHKLRRAEFEVKQLQNRNATIYDENCELSAKVTEMKQILRAHGIPDYEQW